MTRKIRSPIWWATWAVAIGLLLCVPPHASALAPGDPAPAFRLPSIIEGEAEVGSEIFAEAPVTVLIIWDRGCSHCRSVALQSTVLSDSLLPMGGQVFGILLGPDDPQILRDLLWDKEIVTPHLWDYARKSASAYELGFRHIGIFVIDRGGTIRAAFDDKVPDLISPVMPVARVVVRAEAPEGDKPRPVDRGAAEEDRTQPAEQGASQEAGSLRPVRMAARPEAGNFASPSGWPALRVDGRMRLISTEGARPFDTGLYGEELQNGALLLHRWDLRLAWNLARGITFEPWLRVSNEDEAYLTEGAEQLSSRHGTATLRMQSGAFSAALGAYALRVSPFALQRWDAEDAPPIGGGASGCGCGPGSGGVSYRSQEILGPDYTFEGASASWTHRYARVRGFIAIPRWEQAAVQEGDAYQSREPRFRRILHGGVIDFGKAGTEERAYGLASPVGLRLGFVGAEDDRRTSNLSAQYPPIERDERVWTGLIRLLPIEEIALDAEWSGVHTEYPAAHQQDPRKPSGKLNILDGTAARAGLSASLDRGALALRGRLHRLHVGGDFDPLYDALNYEANREGWRGLVAASLLQSPGSARERVGASFFWRDVREIDALTSPALGREEWAIWSASLRGRPLEDLLAEAHWIRRRRVDPGPWSQGSTTNSIALDIRLEKWPMLEPMVRVGAIRSHPPYEDAVTVWQAYGSVRIVN